MPKPNLFAFATSELSQDAFVAWLLAWADPSARTSGDALRRTAITLLDRLLELTATPRPPAYRSVTVSRQHKRIDVLALVNDDIAVLIEDKTHTREHSGQLDRYLDATRAEFPTRRVAPVYLKTGDQSCYAAATRAGYARFGRGDFLAVLRRGVELGVRSDIFGDFHAHLEGIEAAVQAFRVRPVEQWDRACWVGFFVALQERLQEGWWQEVHPPGKPGFMGFGWHWRDGKFLQLEEGRLAFKIEVKDRAARRDGRRAWQDAVTSAAAASGFALKKPARGRVGTWMTVGFGEAYRRVSGGGTLALEETIEGLRRAESVMDAALARVKT